MCSGGLDEGIASHFKIRILIKRCAGGRKQDDRILAAISDGVAQCRTNRVVQRPAFLNWESFSDHGGKLLRGLTNQIGTCNPVEQWLERFNTSCLRDTTCNPVDIFER